MLKEFINQFYLDRHKDRKKTRFYITDAGKCRRSVFFKFKNAPKKKMEARILRLFDHGDYIHMLIMKSLFSARGIHVVSSEIDIPPKTIIGGRADAIISDGKELYVVDIKSMNSMVFRKLEEPKPENIDQLQLYLHFFKIKKGILLYVSKDTQDLKEFILDYDSNRAKRLLQELSELKVKIDADTIPSKLATWPQDWQCRYCQYRDICHMAGEKPIKWEKFKKKIQTEKV